MCSLSPTSARFPHGPWKTFFGADINLEKENLHEIKKVDISKLPTSTEAAKTRNPKFNGMLLRTEK